MAAAKDTAKKNHKRKSSSQKKGIKKPSKYDEKFVVNGTFEEIIKALVTPSPK